MKKTKLLTTGVVIGFLGMFLSFFHQPISNNALISPQKVEKKKANSTETATFVSLSTSSLSILYEDARYSINLDDYKFVVSDFESYRSGVAVSDYYNEESNFVPSFYIVKFFIGYNNADETDYYIDATLLSGVGDTVVNLYEEVNETTFLAFDDIAEEPTDDDLSSLQSQDSYLASYVKANTVSNILPEAPVYSLSSLNLYEKIEEMTSTDEYLDYYTPINERIYFNSSLRYTQDPYIFKIIPEQCFKNVGTYSYFGKEYGFYVNTSRASWMWRTFYCSTVFVFDYDVEFPESGLHRDITQTITPKISYSYYYETRTWYDAANQSEKFDKYFDSSLEEIVYPINAVSNMYLANIGFALELKNYDAPNVGDDDYDPESDYGDFIIDVDYSYRGEGGKEPSNFIGKDLVSLLLSAIPFKGLLDVIYTIGTSVIDALITISEMPEEDRMDYFTSLGYTRIDKAKEELVDGKYPTILAEQVQKYGGPIRTAFTSLGTEKDGRFASVVDSDDPILIGTKTSDNFARMTVGLSSNSNPSYVRFGETETMSARTAAKVKVIRDDTWHFLWWKFGSLTEVANLESDYEWGTYNRYAKGMTIGKWTGKYDTIRPSLKYFKPSVTGDYAYTIEATVDTKIEIYNSANTLITSVKGTAGVTINATLVYNNEYFFKISFDCEDQNITTSESLFYQTIGTAYDSRSYELSMPRYRTYVYKFCETTIVSTTIFTEGDTGTRIVIYDENYEVLYEDDEREVGGNASVSVSFFAYETYYIAVETGSSSGFTTLNVGFETPLPPIQTVDPDLNGSAQ